MADQHFKAGEGALWVQVDGPATEPQYLGCHSVGDIEQPEGDIDLIYCPDPSGPNRFLVAGSVQGAAGAITTTVTADVTASLDYLETVKCPFTLFVHLIETGRRDVFTNYKRSFVLVNSTITSRSLTNLLTRSPDDNARSEQSFEISAETLLRIADFTISTQTVSELFDIVDLAACGDERCRSAENTARAACEVMYAATKDAVGGSPGTSMNVLKTVNGGGTWELTNADPFAVGENIGGIACIELGGDDFRVLAVRGEADAGNPIECAYSDDSGTTWTNVNLAAAPNSEYLASPHALMALSRNDIWVGGSLGHIYHSSNAGITWALQSDSTLTAVAINAIEFIDKDIGWMGGAGNVLGKTIDGGTTWSAIAGHTDENANDVTSIAVLDRNRVWVGYSSGKIYYTDDAGANGDASWTEFTFSGSGAGSVNDIAFFNDLLGYVVHDTAAPLGSVHYTIDGGFTWQSIATPTNAGLNKILICDQWNFILAGNIYGGLGFIAKGTTA